MNNNAQIDGFPVAQLPSRYGVARSVVYSRLSALKIEPSKRKNKAYITNEQLQLLDELNEHLKRKGATVAEFQAIAGLGDKPAQTEPIRLSDSTQDRQTGQLTILDSLAALELLAEALATRMTPPTPQLNHLRSLEEACQNRWLLSTSDLSALLKLSPRTINRQQSFERYGFTFNRTGRNGTEIAWSVNKSGN